MKPFRFFDVSALGGHWKWPRPIDSRLCSLLSLTWALKVVDVEDWVLFLWPSLQASFLVNTCQFWVKKEVFLTPNHMVAEISAFSEELELRQSLQEREPAPHLLAQINSEWSSFLTSLWCCCAGASWISYPRDTTPCCACFSLPLFSKCTDLTLVLIFKQPGWSEVFQNLGSFERSRLPSVSCSVFHHFLFSLLHHWPGTHSHWTVSPCLWNNKKSLYRRFYSPPRFAIQSPPRHTKMERNEWHGGGRLLSQPWI